MDSKPTLLSNIIAAVGFFFILILLIWGLMNITRWLPGLFSLFNAPSKTLTVHVDTNAVPSGTPTTISWVHNATKGSYAFTYECRTGALIRVAESDTSYIALPCATAYVVDAKGPKAIRVIPEVTSTSVSVPITIIYRDDKSVPGAAGTANLNIGFVGTTPSNATTTPAKPTKPTTPVSNVPAVPDLAVRLIGVSSQSGSSIVRPGDIISFRFEVKNVGGAATGSWNFVANLPSSSNPVYTSVTQQSLNPGDRIEYNLSFNGINSNGLISLIVDPNNMVREISESNNQLSYHVQQTY